MGWRDFTFSSPLDKADKEDKERLQPTVRSDSLYPLHPLYPAEVPAIVDGDAAAPITLQDWIDRMKCCRIQREVFEILEQFRQQTWTDLERSMMSHAYIRVLEHLPR